MMLNEISTAKKVCYNFKYISKLFNITDDCSYKNFIRDNVDLSMGICVNYCESLKKTLYLMKPKGSKKYVFIDVPLVNVIRKLNKHGLKTYACCCGHFINRYAYICFKEQFSDSEIQTICDVFWKYDFFIRIEENRIIRWINKTDYSNYDINHCGKIDIVFNEIIESIC